VSDNSEDLSAVLGGHLQEVHRMDGKVSRPTFFGSETELERKVTTFRGQASHGLS
jgi:hypothetical protein